MACNLTGSAMTAMNLLIDIGNSRCKWALAAPAAGPRVELAASGRLDPDDHLDAQFEAIEKISGAPLRAMIACVGSRDVLHAIQDAAQDRWPRLDIRQFKTSPRAHGVTNAYPQPETLGADRWAAMIAARALAPSSSAVIANCGTAVTLDVLDAQGLHQGGYILPGLKLMREALHQGTAALPLAEGRGELTPARNTRSAIIAGTVLSIVAAIESQVRTRPGGVECLLAGGDAETVAENLSIDYRYEPDLVLKGLAIAAAAET
jgi:type III pantothenate kinase